MSYWWFVVTVLLILPIFTTYIHQMDRTQCWSLSWRRIFKYYFTIWIDYAFPIMVGMDFLEYWLFAMVLIKRLDENKHKMKSKVNCHVIFWRYVQFSGKGPTTSTARSRRPTTAMFLARRPHRFAVGLLQRSAADGEIPLTAARYVLLTPSACQYVFYQWRLHHQECQKVSIATGKKYAVDSATYFVPFRHSASAATVPRSITARNFQHFRSNRSDEQPESVARWAPKQKKKECNQ